MASYTVQISEEQRALLESSLGALIQVWRSVGAYRPDDHPERKADSQSVELQMLLDMTRDLPKEEADDPGVIHGFDL